ncbi:MAG: PRC-barrel domain-containing protein [Capsulimonas sp.]|uniref:PRC-barrel domain-containing protein n=1 Tax=Capsulimonas sp. TaxID=2494211 RepID=UPI003263CF5C
MEQGSYLLIEPGMAVHGSDGSHLGSVSELVADTGADIFRGIVVQHGLLIHKHGYISAENLVSVVGNDITTSISKEQFDQLPAQPAPAAVTSDNLT